MRYRGIEDRKISAYAAVLIITIIGSIATLFIVHTADSIDLTYQAQSAALGY